MFYRKSELERYKLFKIHKHFILLFISDAFGPGSSPGGHTSKSTEFS